VKAFSIAVRENRERLQYSQEELAMHVGLTRVTIANIEANKYESTLHTAAKLSIFLGFSLDAVIRDSFEVKTEWREK
jgi:DNA-binding XRE family transcriptional regulator